MSSCYFAHETTVVDELASIGPDSRIWHFSHVSDHAVIGENCVLGQNVFVAPYVLIGNNVKIQNNVSVYQGVQLEDGVFCGPSVVFTNVNNPRATIERKSQFSTTRVCKGATLGANCTIVCGVTIGAFAFIGAGAVVTRDVPAHALLLGNPAKQAGWVCECAGRLNEQLRCKLCDRGYAPDPDGSRISPRAF